MTVQTAERTDILKYREVSLNKLSSGKCKTTTTQSAWIKV